LTFIGAVITRLVICCLCLSGCLLQSTVANFVRLCQCQLSDQTTGHHLTDGGTVLTAAFKCKLAIQIAISTDSHVALHNTEH